MSDKEMPITVTYELTSGGTALVEKLMAATPHEMVTVYANRGNRVHITHYSMLGNQPEMSLIKAEGGHFEFALEGLNGISDKNEMHMHAVSIFLKDHTLKQEWTNYKDNKKSEVAVFEFTKKS